MRYTISFPAYRAFLPVSYISPHQLVRLIFQLLFFFPWRRCPPAWWCLTTRLSWWDPGITTCRTQQYHRIELGLRLLMNSTATDFNEYLHLYKLICTVIAYSLYQVLYFSHNNLLVFLFSVLDTSTVLSLDGFWTPSKLMMMQVSYFQFNFNKFCFVACSFLKR